MSAARAAPQAEPVVLATDFGRVSSAAERAAFALALRERRPVIAVHAIQAGPIRRAFDGRPRRADQLRAAVEVEAAAFVDRAVRLGIDARVLIWSGDPARCVVDAAAAEGAVRIVVGSHGRGRLGRVLAGSVSEGVVRLASCPVEVVREDARTRRGQGGGSESGPDGPADRAIRP